MGIRRWLVEQLGRGTPPELDPDELIEVENMPLTEGPMLVSTLEQQGIEAVSLDRFDAISGLTRARILVRRRDEAAALTVLREPPDAGSG